MLAICVITYLLITLPAVIYASKRVHNSRDYVLAGRNLPFFVSLSTVFATWFGAEAVMGTSSRVVENGLIGIVEDPFGASLCLILIGVFFAHKLYSQNHLTLGDYFEARYSRKAANWLSAIIASTYVGWIGAQLVALGIILELVLGLPFMWGITLSCFIVMVYTYLGGMWSVALTDTIQMSVIVISMIIALFQIEIRMGAWAITLERTPKEFFRILPEWDTNSILSYLNAWIILGLGSIPQQDVYQRAMSAKTARISRMASIMGGITYFIFALVPVCIALAARAMHPELLDINPQYFLPLFIMEHADIFTQSLFFGGLIAAILSTASGALLAASSLFAENVVTMFYRPPTDKARLWLIRHVLLVVALLSLGLGFYQGYIYELVSSAYSISLVGAFVPLVFGLYSKKATAQDSMFCSLCGIVVWLAIRLFASEEFVMPAPLGGLLASLAAMFGSIWIKRFLPQTRKAH